MLPPASGVLRSLDVIEPRNLRKSGRHVAVPRQLSNPPIVEALIDLRTVLPEDFSAEAFRDMHEQLKDRFPKVQPLRAFEGKVEFNQGRISQSAADRGVMGYRFQSDDDSRIVQFRHDGFTLNHLTPYQGWDQLRAEAESLWQCYVSAANPERVERIATRYINHIELPIPTGDLREHLTEPPEIPDGLPQVLTEYFQRIVIADHEDNLAANLVQAIPPSQDESDGTITVILDIDAYAVEAHEPASPALWERFEVLREFKNQAFFGSLQESTVEAYE